MNKQNSWDSMPLHIAKKNIPETGQPGYKFEYFIFDILPFAKNPKVIVYPRNACFLPLKDKSDIEKVQLCDYLSSGDLI